MYTHRDGMPAECRQSVEDELPQQHQQQSNMNSVRK